MPSAASGRVPRRAPPASAIVSIRAMPVANGCAPAMVSAVGGASPTQSSSEATNSVRDRRWLWPPTSRTRPQANRPSESGIDQNWPGSSCAFVRGTNGYAGAAGAALNGSTPARRQSEWPVPNWRSPASPRPGMM